MSEWIKIEEGCEMPAYGESVLIWRKDFPIHIAYRAKLGFYDYFVISLKQVAFPATHWRSLPKEPVEVFRERAGEFEGIPDECDT